MRKNFTESEALEFIRENESNAEEIIADVKQCPDYFVMEGGSDGTFGHFEFLENYGHLMPAIVDLAVIYGGEV